MFTLGEYKFVVCTTPALKEQVHRLRYQVYVEEYKFEKPEDHPDGQEKDEFDDHAILFAVIDPMGRVMGTSRLILNGPKGLPALRLAEAFYADPNPASGKIAEVSRLALHPTLRGSVADAYSDVDFYITKALGEAKKSHEGDKAWESWQQRVVALLGLIQLMYHVGQSLAITDYYVVAERSLHVLLKRHKIHFRPLGPPIEHHGIREVFRGLDWEIGPPILAFERRVTSALGLEELQPPAVRDGRFAQGDDFDLGGFQFRVARTEADLEALYALRDRLDQLVPVNTTVQLGPYEQRSGRDAFDSHAVHLVAKDRADHVVATIRLILNSAKGLPCMAFVHPDYPERTSMSKKNAELGRFALAQPYLAAFFDMMAVARFSVAHEDAPPLNDPVIRRNRSRATLIFMGLLRLAYRLSKSLRVTKIHMVMDIGVAEFLARRGFYSHRLGDPAKLNGVAAPYVMYLPEIEPAMLDFRAVRSVLRDLTSVSHRNDKFDPLGLAEAEGQLEEGKG